MNQPKVYFTRQISPASLVKIFEKLNTPMPGKTAVKLSTGEAGNPNYLKPELIKDLVQKVDGTIIECNTAYLGARNDAATHLQTAKAHGFTDIAKVDIMDAEGEMEIPVHGGRHLEVDIIGKNFPNYDSMINLAHFKGHPAGGFGGALKNQSIGIASAVGKVYIHTAGRSRNLDEFFHAFDTEENIAKMLPAQDDFLASMAEAAKAVADYMQANNKPIVYINVINNLSVDCDCVAEPEAPCMQDIGIAASLDPVALDQACLDLIYNSNDPGRDHFVEHVESMHGVHTIEVAEQLGLGVRNYELEQIDL